MTSLVVRCRHVVTFFLSLSLSLSLLVCLLDLTVDLHTNIISSNLLVLLLSDLFVVPCYLGKTARTEVAHWRGEWPTQLESSFQLQLVGFWVWTHLPASGIRFLDQTIRSSAQDTSSGSRASSELAKSLVKQQR